MRDIQIIFIKQDFLTPALPVINSLRDVMETFFLKFIALIFFLIQYCTSLNILRCCVFRIKIKLLNSSLEISLVHCFLAHYILRIHVVDHNRNVFLDLTLIFQLKKCILVHYLAQIFVCFH